MKKITLHEPVLHKNDLALLNKAFKSTWIAGSGKYVNLLEEKIRNFTSAKYAVGCNSGSAGLFLSLKALGIKNMDEVIVPTITFVATINSITQNNASPVFMDCDRIFNIDIEKTLQFLNNETFTKNKITYNKKTKKRIFALIVVHCFGFPVKMEKIVKICKEKGIFLIEDAAESLGSKYKIGKYKNFHTGTIGDVGVISFNANKIITGGGGGIIISQNKKIVTKIRYLIDQAKDDTIKFIHNESGYNLRISNLQCSIIFSQMKRVDEILKKKIIIHDHYKKILDKKKFNLLRGDETTMSNYWINIINIIGDSGKKYNQLLNILIKNKIGARYVWYPNHLQKPFKKYQSYKVTRATCLVKKSICLPSGLSLKKNDIYQICNVINRN